MVPATGHDDGVANHNMIFISTSLDTHLAMIVSHSDTVSDFKRKVMLEHRQLFPTIGDITVESLKVKQRGIFYHLSDSVLVKSAFNAAKRNWFVSVDASRVEQNDGVQHTVNHKAGDQLALPWVTHSHWSPSDHSKIAPLVNHKFLNVDQLTSGDSCKDVSKNVEEDRLCSVKQLDSELQQNLDTVNADISLKKRTRNVHNESSPKDGFGPGPSAKKKRKTRGKSDAKALEENLVLTHVNDKLNNETTFENKTEGKDLRDENIIINKGENCSANDQVATNVVTTEGVGSETVGDVAMVVENNIQQEMFVGMSQKEKDNVLFQKPAMEDEIHSSLMRTPDCEHAAAEVTVAGHMKHLTKHNTAEKEVSSTSIIKELHNTNESSPKDMKKKRKIQRIKALEENLALTHDDDKGNNENAFEHKTEGEDSRDENNRINKGENCSGIDLAATDVITTEGVGSETVGDVAMVVENNIQQEMSVRMSQKEKDSELVLKPATESSTQQDVGSNGQEHVGDQIDKHKKDSETSLKQKPELKLPERKKGAKGSENIGEGKRRRTKKVFKHADNFVGDILSMVIDSVVEEGKINEVSEKTSVEDKKDDDVIMKEVEVSVKNMEENSRKEFTDTNDVVSVPVTNEDSLIPHSETLMNYDADVSITEKNTSQVNAQGVPDNLEKPEEKMDDTPKKKKKRKTKKSSRRNEDELLTKRIDGDIIENVDIKDDDKVDQDAQIELQDLPSKHQSIEAELESKKSQSVDHHHLSEKISKNVTESEADEVSVKNMEENPRKEFTDTNDVVSVPVTNEDSLIPHSESLMNNDADVSITEKNTSQVNAQGVLDNLEKPNEKMDDTTKKRKKRQTKKSSRRNEDELLTKRIDGDIIENVDIKDDDIVDQDAQIELQDLPIKHQSIEAELESMKSQSVDHHLSEKISKNVTESEVSKFNNEVDILEAGFHELHSMDNFAPGHQPKKIASIDNKKDMKKTQVSVDVFKEPNTTNVDKMKTSKRTKKIDAQKTNKQQPDLGSKSAVKKNVKRLQRMSKRLLNASGTIFGSDDDAPINLVSKKHPPSRKSSSTQSPSSSSSSSSSGEILSRSNRSYAKKGNEGAEKNNTYSRSKSTSIGNLLRSSSAFKKAKVIASSQVADSESQPVDFVPESQL